MAKRERSVDSAESGTVERKAHRAEDGHDSGAPNADSGTTKQMLHTSIAQGPFCVLDSAMRDNIRVFIQCRFNKSLLATVVAFDKHFNLVLQDVIELTASEREDQKPRSIRNLFLRGESVIFIVKMNQEGK